MSGMKGNPGRMSNEENVPCALLEIASEAQRIVAELPAGMSGTVDFRGRHVYMELSRPGSPAFEVVLGSDVPEIVYDAQFFRFESIGGEMEDQFDFIRRTVDEITEFLLSGRAVTKGKSRILKRTYLRIPLSDGSEWKMKKFSSD